MEVAEEKEDAEETDAMDEGVPGTSERLRKEPTDARLNVSGLETMSAGAMAGCGWPGGWWWLQAKRELRVVCRSIRACTYT